jgi:hypothetical protein
MPAQKTVAKTMALVTNLPVKSALVPFEKKHKRYFLGLDASDCETDDETDDAVLGGSESKKPKLIDLSGVIPTGIEYLIDNHSFAGEIFAEGAVFSNDVKMICDNYTDVEAEEVD